MRPTTRKTSSNHILRAVTALAAMATSMGSLAEPWEFAFGGDLSAIYTDNLALAEPGFETSDTVFMVAPNFEITKDSERIEADIRYRPEGYFYSNNSEFNDIYHVVDAQVTAALVPQALYVFASAVNYQTAMSPEINFPTTNLPVTGNRIDATILEFRPYWDQDLGFANVLLEAAYVDSQYDNQGAPDPDFNENNVQKRGYFRLDNYEDQEGLAWGVDYLVHRFEYEEAVPWNYQRAALSLGFWVNGQTRIFGRSGVETDYENFLQSNLDGDFWEAGFQYKPNNRLDFEIAAGKRSFGNSKRLNFTYTLKRGSTALSYSEEPTTYAELGYDYRPISAIDNLDGFLNRPGSTDIFIQKRGEWTTQIELAKSRMDLRVFAERREQRNSNIGEPLEDEDYAGAAFRWAWDLGTKSTVRFLFDFVSSEYTDSLGPTNADLTSIGADYEYRLTQRFALIVYAHHAQERGDTGRSRDYDENQVRLTLRTKF
jgi:hypothetical protein